MIGKVIRLSDLSPATRAKVIAQGAGKPGKAKTTLEEASAFFLSRGVPAPVAEHKFHPLRRWRFDYAWPAEFIALEVEGGVWTGGRHTRGAGFVKDMEKYNAATVLGWRVLRVQPRDLLKHETAGMVADLIRNTQRNAA